MPYDGLLHSDAVMSSILDCSVLRAVMMMLIVMHVGVRMRVCECGWCV